MFVFSIEILELDHVGTGPANLFGKRTPCKKSADLHPRQGNLLQRNNFSVAYKTSSQNRVEISRKK
jgi:hypothetical protein